MLYLKTIFLRTGRLQRFSIACCSINRVFEYNPLSGLFEVETLSSNYHKSMEEVSVSIVNDETLQRVSLITKSIAYYFFRRNIVNHSSLDSLADLTPKTQT